MTGDGRFARIGGAVLTGGASARMGRDKARLEVGGVAVATRLAGLLATLCEDVALVGGEPPADAPGRFVDDVPGPRCALRGLIGALEAFDTQKVLVVATDLPLLTPELLLALVAWPDADAVVPDPEGGPQPLCALYRREPALARARANFESDRLALRALLDALETDYLGPSDLAAVDPLGRALHNVNTPDDLARAEVWLRSPGQGVSGSSSTPLE